MRAAGSSLAPGRYQPSRGVRRGRVVSKVWPVSFQDETTGWGWLGDVVAQRLGGSATWRLGVWAAPQLVARRRGSANLWLGDVGAWAARRRGGLATWRLSVVVGRRRGGSVAWLLGDSATRDPAAWRLGNQTARRCGGSATRWHGDLIAWRHGGSATRLGDVVARQLGGQVTGCSAAGQSSVSAEWLCGDWATARWLCYSAARRLDRWAMRWRGPGWWCEGKGRGLG